ncbi:MAG: ribosome small subunit-dependent GTPase A [Actinobacteria bacterium]|nr:ribosome small subunit-dependent GTPase A [Actinomycetota bacterium]
MSSTEQPRDLEALGWDDAWGAMFARFRERGLEPARISAPHRGGAYDVLTSASVAAAAVRAHLPARTRRTPSSDVPVVGDWVALDPNGETPTIEAVLPRRTKLSRRAAHDPGADVAREQVVAANVDVVFITASLADELSARLLERYLTLAWESGASPAILLMKADLEPDSERIADELAEIAGHVPIAAVSTRTGFGLERVRSLLGPGMTGALIGPSGVGKSTLVNTLVGEEVLDTGDVADDGSGRHTTTRRQLVLLPGGGIVVDNPGIRELHLWLADEGLDETFADIVELASHCRFADCRHETEPGCAVQAALASGDLSAERWASYRELQRELAELEERLARRGRSRARRMRPGTGDS